MGMDGVEAFVLTWCSSDSNYHGASLCCKQSLCCSLHLL